MRYKTIQNAANKAAHKQISFDDLVCGRFRHIKRGHTDLKIDDIDMDGLLKVLGGRTLNRWHIRDYLKHGRSHGILSRLIYSRGAWEYVAGQDYRSELRTIRNILAKG